jgi:hypothetical protein
MELVAACPTFRTVVGAADSDEAMIKVLSPWADDHWLDESDHDLGIVNPPPRATINHFGWERMKLGTAYGGTAGSLSLCFEFLADETIDAADPNFPNLQLARFEDLVGQIMDELEARVGQDRPDAEAIFTEAGVTHLNVTEIALVEGPGEIPPAEKGGQLWYGVVFILNYK